MTARAVRTSNGSRRLSFADFFALNGEKTQIYPINATQETRLTGFKGTQLIIAPYSFTDLSGNIITGPVQLHLKEVFTKSEMVLTNKVSTSEDRMLESGGQFYVAAFQGNTALKLKTPIKVILPINRNLSNPLSIRLFEGSLAITRSFRQTNAFDWRLSSDRKLPIQKQNGQKYFQFNINQFNWYNCDAFYAKKAARTMVSARVTENHLAFDEKAAFIVFKDANCVARMYNNGNHFTSFNIPQKKAASIVVLALRDGQLYYGCTAIRKTTGRMVDVQLNAGEIQDLKLLLNTL